MYKLIYSDTGVGVRAGDVVTDFRGDSAVVASGVGEPPHHSGFTGKIWVEKSDLGVREYYPNVFDCVWVDDAYLLRASVYDCVWENLEECDDE